MELRLSPKHQHSGVLLTSTKIMLKLMVLVEHAPERHVQNYCSIHFKSVFSSWFRADLYKSLTSVWDWTAAVQGLGCAQCPMTPSLQFIINRARQGCWGLEREGQGDFLWLRQGSIPGWGRQKNWFSAEKSRFRTVTSYWKLILNVPSRNIFFLNT